MTSAPWLTDDEEAEDRRTRERFGIKRLGRWKKKSISYDTEGERASDLGTNILATFEYPGQEVIIRCGDAVVVSSEEIVRSAPHDKYDVNFLQVVGKAELYSVTKEFQRDKADRRFFLARVAGGFLVRKVVWEDALPGDFS